MWDLKGQSFSGLLNYGLDGFNVMVCDLFGYLSESERRVGSGGNGTERNGETY